MISIHKHPYLVDEAKQNEVEEQERQPKDAHVGFAQTQGEQVGGKEGSSEHFATHEINRNDTHSGSGEASG